MDFCFRKEDYQVRSIEIETCRELVERFHYSRSGSNTGVYTHGLIRKSDMGVAGCAWWLPPTKGAAKFVWPKGDWRKVLALSRLVVVPGIPKNAASFLISNSIKLIKQDKRFECLVSYADKAQGHTGVVYKASNWEEVDETLPSRTYTLNGQIISRRAGQKTHSHAELISMGAQTAGWSSKRCFRYVL